ncbi:ABC transporter ATP-binding protein [Massilia sp. TSP1-1-2]|uniref:ABC transporter ATP-binding protein n=1 Tax=Massilia sp. TSP1-1-2 TaxID=2804649 RepID=UPI003CF2AAAD
MTDRHSHSNAERGSVRRLYLQLIKPQRMGIALFFALLILAMGLQVPLPFLLSKVIDGLSSGLPFAELRPVIFLLVGLSVAGLVLSIGSQIFSAKLNRRFAMDARLTVFHALQHAPLRFSSQFNVSDLYTRMTGDLAVLNYFLPTGIAAAARHVCAVLVYGVILLKLSATVVLYIVWLLPLAGVIFYVARKRMSVLAKAAHAGVALSNATILESLNGLREGRVTGSRPFHHQRLRTALLQSEEKLLTARIYSALMFGTLGLIPIIVTAMIWVIGGWKISTHEMTVGSLVSFMFALSMLYGPINGLFGVASGYVFEVAAFERVAALFTTSTVAPAVAATLAVERERGAAAAAPAFEVRDVAFAYGDEAVFSGFNASIPAGLCTTLAGSNGAGKSTLLSLLCGLEAPTGGSVLLNGMPVTALEADYLANHVGYLPQNILVFGDTLRMNITMGRSISDAQVLAAGAELGLDDFLADWKQGLDTVILESGRDLSGGQKQKIALLRAVVNQPAILILDEPENNLDHHALTHLLAYLRRAKGKCTVLLVTHGAAFEEVIDRTLEISAGARPFQQAA